MTLKLGITWPLAADTGWGLIALHLACEFQTMPDVEVSFWQVKGVGISALDAALLRPVVQRCQGEAAALARGQRLEFDGILLHADGNHFNADIASARVVAEKNVGLMVFEDTAFTPDELERGKRYDWLVTASRWNQAILRRYELESRLIHQGIDPTIFHPAPKSGRWSDRFVVFSGGKLEYRKGQDIVLAAFREFRESHPDALLVTAWANQWPALACDMTLAGHVKHEPPILPSGVDVEGWCEDNGLPEGSHIDVGVVPNAMLGPIMREADVAVFASRAEGATNLMAMEAIACRIPTLMGRNTGHADYGGYAYPSMSASAKPSRHFTGVDGWYDVNIQELAEMMHWYSKGPCAPAFRTYAQYARDVVEMIRG